MYVSAPLSSRYHFGGLLTGRGLTGHAVEVGTHRAEFAVRFLAGWGGKFYAVDPWHNPPGYEHQSTYLVGGGTDRGEDYSIAVKALDLYRPRVCFMRCLSAEAARTFADDTLDFVYVDGDHSREHVHGDLRRWWVKVKPGGILAGHDWLCPGEKDGGWGRFIQPEVHLFAESHEVDVHLVPEAEGHPWSFFFEKPDPANPKPRVG